jgi:hypothetical protein
MVDYLKEFAEGQYTEVDVLQAKEKYLHGTPFTKESLLYREIFEKHLKLRNFVVGYQLTLADVYLISVLISPF